MSAKVDLYNSAYANYGSDVYQQVRIETYGHDLGQTSWVPRKSLGKFRNCSIWNVIRQC